MMKMWWYVALFGPVFQLLKWPILLFDHFISSETWKMHLDATRVMTKRREWELQKHDSSLLAWHLNFTKCHKWFHCNVTKVKDISSAWKINPFHGCLKRVLKCYAPDVLSKCRQTERPGGFRGRINSIPFQNKRCTLHWFDQ